MPKTVEKKKIKITENIERRPSSERQKRLWRAWWRCLIALVREELESETKSEK